MHVKLFHIKTQQELNVEIRLFKDTDAKDVVECIRAEYGETYFKKQFYDPDYLIKMNNENTITLIVAETEAHVVGGVIALKSFFPGETMCELASEIFKKEYRGYRLSEKMIQFGMEIIESRCYSSIYALPVTFHDISQRLLKRNGMVATGFILSVFDINEVQSSYPYGKCLKHSQGIQIKALEKQNVGTLFLHKEISPVAEKIYSKLGVAFEIDSKDSTDNKSIPKKTMLYHTIDTTHKNCAITALKIGEDIAAQIEAIYLKYKDIYLQTFNVFININDPNAIEAYKKLKQLGFFFTGFKSLCSDNEYMVMHNNNGVEMHLEDYVLTEEFEELMKFIMPFI